MERADVQQEAALETAAPLTVQRQREQQRIQARSYINPRDSRLQLSGLASASQAEPQLSTTPAQPLHSDSAAAPVSVERDYARNHNGRLPAADLLQRRETQRQVVAASKKQRTAVPLNQRQCLKCGASTCSRSSHGHWRRHPVTKEEWMCHGCYNVAQQQMKRKRQHDMTATEASSSDEAWEEGEEAQPPSQSPPSPQQQAAHVQPPMPGPPVQQRVPAIVSADGFAEARQQQHLQALSRQQQRPPAVTPDAKWEPAFEQPALLPAHMPPPQPSTGLLVLEAAQQAAAMEAGLTEGLAGTFAALLPMPAEQDACLRLMLQHRQYSGAAGMMRAVLHVRGIPPPGLIQALWELH
ncbi:hypothetical protein D9Q98_004912 [Chlorella vulgaris]|uniref:Uncharacterized protein n=1 Tax=Chlorella vulgaris TaxID=3077 RepID=A0A9D4YWH4_CHLVU|nr:hypothetical protein D9Q98_004912 [Chlorella vulgaris]